MDELSPEQQLAQYIHGFWHSQAIYVAAKLGLADRIAKHPQTPEELAQATGANPQALYRLLRALAGLGIFAEDATGRFAMTPLAEPLRSDGDQSQQAVAIMMNEEHYHVWGDLLFAVQTGQNAFERIYGMPIFEYLSENPQKGQLFDAAMTGIHGRETAAVSAAYDFSGFQRVIDVGGGNGSQLAAILQQHPTLRGILFDLPPVVQRARGALEQAGVANRCELASGDFFQSVPGGADAYLLRHIIHDWDDAKAFQILRNCHAAMPAGARLLVIESIIPPGNAPSFAKFLDLTMMLIPGGKERTEEEYRHLYEAAGFQWSRVVPTTADVSVIEGIRR